MANLVISYTNHLEAAQLVAADETEDGPVANLLNIHVVTKWRSLTVPTYFTADLGVARTIRFLALFGVSLSTGGTLRLRLSTTDAHNGDVYDSGAAPAAPALSLEQRHQCLHVLPAAAVARYARVDLDDPGADFVDLGYAVLDDWVKFAWTRSWGAGDGTEDPSLISKPIGGQTIITKRPNYRVSGFSLDFIKDNEKSHIKGLNNRRGSSGPVVVIPDHAAVDAAEEMMLCRIRQVEPLVRRQVNIRSRAFAIEELI